MSALQERMLDGNEIEGLILGVGQVASPQLQTIMSLFPSDGRAQQGIERLAQCVGFVPVDVACGTHIGSKGDQLVPVSAECSPS